MSEVTYQASLGQDRKATYNSGQIRIGRITKIYPKRYTAEILFEGTGDEKLSDGANEGQDAAPITVSFAGYSDDYGKPYGEIKPVHVGERVVVGMTGDSEAVILGNLHINDEDDGDTQMANILYASHDTQQNLDDWIKIYPNQDFIIRREDGSWEYSLNNHSFVECKSEYIPADDEDFTDLSLSDEFGDTISGTADTFRPTAFLLSLVNNFIESAAQHIKVYIEGARSVFKIIQHIGETVSYIRFWKDGSIRIRRQMDTISTEEDECSWDFADVTLTADKCIYVRVCGDKNTIIHLNQKGLNIYTDLDIDINAEGNMSTCVTGTTKFYSHGNFEIHTDGDFKVSANGTIDENASQQMNLHANGLFSADSNSGMIMNARGSFLRQVTGGDCNDLISGDLTAKASNIYLN